MRAAIGRRTMGAALLTALALLPAAGCGDDVKPRNAYVDQVNSAQRRFVASFERLSSQITRSSTRAQDRRTLEGFDEAIGETVSELDDIEPPGEVRSLHARLAREIAGYGEVVREARDALSSRSPEAIAAAQAELAKDTSKASAAVGRTIDQINARLRE